jgi:translation initiation factor 1 (eIF-1/SUI1)
LRRADPFADEADAPEEDNNEGVVKGKTYVHVRVQQRNGRKSLTTVQARVVLRRACALPPSRTACDRARPRAGPRTAPARDAASGRRGGTAPAAPRAPRRNPKTHARIAHSCDARPRAATRCQRARSFSAALAPFARHVRALTRSCFLIQRNRFWLSFSVHQGIDPTVDYKKVLKAFKKEFCCNGTVVEDPEQARTQCDTRRAQSCIACVCSHCARMC